MSIFDQAVHAFPSGAKLPGTEYEVKGCGRRHGESAIVYYVPNRKQTAKPSEKGFTSSELCHAFHHLLRAKEFTWTWFNAEIERGKFSRGAPCNFHAIGGVFVGLGLAAKERSRFRLVRWEQNISVE